MFAYPSCIIYKRDIIHVHVERAPAVNSRCTGTGRCRCRIRCRNPARLHAHGRILAGLARVTRLHAWSFGRTESIQQGKRNRGAVLALTLAAFAAFSLAPAFAFASRRARAGRGSCRWDLTQTNTVAFESCTITICHGAGFLIK